MSEKIKLFCDRFPIETLKTAAAQLLLALKANKGARIGEASVISRQVHVYTPSKPEVVQVLLNADAGQTFYHRKDSGKIYHIDVFHQCGLVDPVLVAESIKSAIALYHTQGWEDTSISDAHINPDWIDIQTGSGGGRITGKLSYGKKTSLCKVHENHVHIAMMMPYEQLIGLFYVVNAVERSILASSLELRCNENIISINNNCNAKMDLSQFSAQTDSLLRDNSDILLSQEQTDCLEDNNNEDTEVLMKNFNTISNNINNRNNLQFLDQNRVLFKKLNEVASDDQFLVGLNENGTVNTIFNYLSSIKSKIIGSGYRSPKIAKLEEHLRSIKKTGSLSGRLTGSKRILPVYYHYEQSKKISQKIGSMLVAELDISETIHAAACRKISERKSSLLITKKDLREYVRHRRKGNDLCLIIDASASMDGKRINAAKSFARQLLSRVKGRIGIVTFQENEAQIKVPLTRNYIKIEKGLCNIQAYGRTPLALGLKAGVQHLYKAKSRNGIIILVTDGLADDSNSTTQQSLNDALMEAKSIKKYGYQFIGIGLKPHQDYLVQLSQAAGGAMYVFDEINSEVLNCDNIL